MIDGHRWPDGVREGFSDDHHVKALAFIPLASTLAWRIGDNSLALDLDFVNLICCWNAWWCLTVMLLSSFTMTVIYPCLLFFANCRITPETPSLPR